MKLVGDKEKDMQHVLDKKMLPIIVYLRTELKERLKEKTKACAAHSNFKVVYLS